MLTLSKNAERVMGKLSSFYITNTQKLCTTYFLGGAMAAISLALGTSYKFTTPFNLDLPSSANVNSYALKGFSFLINFKFGRF